ncbi:hypothetical protein K488DRAFT_89368 [Vararia minispora EC-137]|uniref:Uncharacterized protein n=1 Tax=Vararia minispora EC-137 TaxID=1314806 RepID=A0ACB8QB37_9AGAM|nr:hypothetical protein K488DRAFT_89368 [Vararia minispora EC-137]
MVLINKRLMAIYAASALVPALAAPVPSEEVVLDTHRFEAHHSHAHHFDAHDPDTHHLDPHQSNEHSAAVCRMKNHGHVMMCTTTEHPNWIMPDANSMIHDIQSSINSLFGHFFHRRGPEPQSSAAAASAADSGLYPYILPGAAAAGASGTILPNGQGSTAASASAAGSGSAGGQGATINGPLGTSASSARVGNGSNQAKSGSFAGLGITASSAEADSGPSRSKSKSFSGYGIDATVTDTGNGRTATLSGTPNYAGVINALDHV